MFIKDIIRVGDSNIDDMLVDIVVSDGKYDCIVMYDFPELKKGDILNNPLYTLSSDNIKISIKEIGLYKLKNYYAYEVVGILDKKNSIVSVGNILIKVDGDIPGDIINNAKIEFQCDRLDCMG